MSATRNVGSRRIFPAMFKLQVLDAYRVDPECKGNQRATARKFNIHRRQIQKWLQCEPVLRANVADALRYDRQHLTPNKTAAPPLGGHGASRVFKHDARTLKLVAQKLYPSSYSGAAAVLLEDNSKGETVYAAVPSDGPIRKPSIDETSLILKDSVQKYADEPCGLPRPTPLFSRPPALSEPFNLVMPRARSATPPVMTPPAAPRPASAGSLSASPLPARVAEIVADSKTSAFSPKRKWLQDSLLEQSSPLSLTVPKKPSPPTPPPIKKPRLDFSVARLCGSPPKETIKTETILLPAVFPPPPLVLPPHRAIPELMSLHFKPEPYQDTCVKQEAFSDDEPVEDDEDDEETIDVLSTSPTEKKSFDYLNSAKRRSFSVQFKLNVLDAFYNDKDCNQNQRATARKFNINRRQVQKWLSVEDELRGWDGEFDGCAGCPRHCTLTAFKCQNCPLGDFECTRPQLPPVYNLPWFHPYDVAAIY